MSSLIVQNKIQIITTGKRLDIKRISLCLIRTGNQVLRVAYHQKQNMTSDTEGFFNQNLDNVTQQGRGLQSDSALGATWVQSITPFSSPE